MQCSSKVPASYFANIGKPILKFIWKGKRPGIRNTIFKLKNKIGGLTLPDTKTYYEAIIRHSCTDERINRLIRRIESPEIAMHKYSQLIFDKGYFSQQMMLEQLGIFMSKNESPHRL